MKRLTIGRLERAASSRTGATSPSATTLATLTGFDLPVVPTVDWPFLPLLEHAAECSAERAILTALDAGLSLADTIDIVRGTLASLGASLADDDLVTLVTAVGLQRS